MVGGGYPPALQPICFHYQVEGRMGPRLFLYPKRVLRTVGWRGVPVMNEHRGRVCPHHGRYKIPTMVGVVMCRVQWR